MEDKTVESQVPINLILDDLSLFSVLRGAGLVILSQNVCPTAVCNRRLFT